MKLHICDNAEQSIISIISTRIGLIVAAEMQDLEFVPNHVAGVKI